MADIDVITIPRQLVHELRHGAVREIGCAAAELQRAADAMSDLVSDRLDTPRFDSFWMPAERVERLLKLASALEAFTEDEVANVDGKHRIALAEAANYQEGYRRSEIGELNGYEHLEDIRALTGTIEALAAFSAELDREHVAA